MIKVEDYHVHKITRERLNKFGFRNGVYKQWVYKKIIQIEIFVSVDNCEWYYQVVDTSHSDLYGAYYDREYGKNKVASEVSKKVKEIIEKMVENNILIKVKEN